MNNHIIGDLLEYVIGGGWGSEAPEGDQNTPNYVIRSADFPSIEKGSFDGVPLRFDTLNFVNKRSLQDGDILLEISGGTKNRPTGRTVYISEKLLSSVEHAVIPASFCRLLRFKKEVVFPKYMYYLLQSWWVSGGSWEFQNQSTGIANFQFKIFAEKFEVSLPPSKEQERIAGILGSLDDKIEANTRLIQTLLDTADSVFQKFYSECELSESTYASLEVYGGGTPSTKNEMYWGGDIHWLTPTDVTSLGSPILFDTARKLTEDGLNACSSKLHPAGSIMMTSRATIGAFAINQYPAATNQGFIVAVPQREEERWWIYHHMKKDVPEMINSANGTTFLEISRRTFKGLPYSSLSDENLDRFHAVVNPLYELVKSSEQENLQLAATRDALIKRLIG